MNERLALHYGIRTMKGSHFRRVTWPSDSVRRGLLGHGSILTLTSYPDRTSPVVRGKWILENVLGTPPPPPLPDVGVLQTTDGTGKVLSMRERLSRHRANPVCSSCHSMLDPLGLALENFDAVGTWHARDESSQPIDASAVLPDGTKVVGPEGLDDSRPLRSLCRNVYGKALDVCHRSKARVFRCAGRAPDPRQAASNDFRVASGIILGVVDSTPFQLRRAQQ